MKLLIKSNGKMNKVNVERRKFYDDNDNEIVADEVYSIEIDFEQAALWSDFELWLEDEGGNFADYKKINISKRNKMQMFT